MRKFYWFLLPYAALLCAMVTLLCIYEQQEAHLLLNAYHTSLLDHFCRYYTQLAEWPVYVLALVPLFWQQLRPLTGVYAIAEGSGAIVVQVLKHIFHRPRPAAVFADHMDLLPTVEGVHLHHSNSFPSGHSSTFFIFFACCAIYLSIYYAQKKPQIKWGSFWRAASILLLFLLATWGCYSRIYLSQHFLLDVCVGSFIGISVACTVCYCFRDRLKRSLSAS